MKTLVCTIGRLENQYIREWVEYYKNLGFTNICLYDNNKDGEENFEDVIGDYIESGFVILKDYRDKTVCQLDAYTECYTEYGNEYDWIAFFDCDEFLTLTRNKTIEQYLKRLIFKNASMIHINWMNFNDNELITNDGRPLLERFKNHCNYDYRCEYNFPENYHIKSIVRGGLTTIAWINNPHTPFIDQSLICCNGSGGRCESKSPFVPYTYSDAYIRHFTTKTIEEYCNKLKRGFPDQTIEAHNKRLKLLLETRFFKTNTITKEKIDFVNNSLGIDMSYLLDASGHTEGKSDDVKIYSLCYSKKDFKFLDDSVITPLQVGAANGTDVCELKDNTGENISAANFFYVENTGTYWIWRNVHNCKYKGQMQYRRPLDGINEDFNFDKAFETYDVITCVPFNHPANSTPTAENNYTCIPAKTVEEGYKFSNNGKDIEILENVIKTSFPEYAESYDKYIKKGENLYYSSGFILRADDYDRYCEFLFNVLNTWLAMAKITNQFDLYYYLGACAGQGYLKAKLGDNPLDYPKPAIKWESEIGGFLGERIWTLWLLHNYSTDRILTKPYIKMEEGMYT